MKKILNNNTDSIVVTRKRTGEIVEAESGNELIACISNDEIILHDDYEVKIVPAIESN